MGDIMGIAWPCIVLDILFNPFFKVTAVVCDNLQGLADSLRQAQELLLDRAAVTVPQNLYG